MPASKRTAASHCHAPFRIATGIRPRAPGTFSPQQIGAAYGLPTNVPPGAVIAIIELGGGYLARDVLQFFEGVHLPVPALSEVNVGARNSPGGDADVEVALDIDVAAGVYSYMTGQAARVRMYWCNDISAGVERIIHDIGAGVDIGAVSISWGDAEAGWGAQECHAEDDTYKKLAALGIPFFCASGDNGSSDGAGGVNVDFPASSPHVLGCGGTTLTAREEIVWNDGGGGATGGGYSAVFGPQTWQVGIPSAPRGLGRMVPDVAGNADPNTGYNIFCGGSWMVVGGTSAVSPLWAGVVAALGWKPALAIPGAVYSLRQCFSDIVRGSNGAYSAQVGPDACTGMGTPRGVALRAAVGLR